MSNILTTSRLRTWRDCRRKHRLKYIDGWRPTQPSEALRFGSLVHTGLEGWWRAEPDDRLGAALRAMAGRGIDPYEQAAADELLRGYDDTWAGSDEYEVLAVEVPFFVPLVNPETGGTSRTWVLAGKLDGVLRDRHGRVLLLEHKTTTDSFADDSDTYWTKLGMDAQVSHYYLGAEGLGFRPEGCVYDVLLRPRQKVLRATPESKRKYKANGELYANLRAEDETPEQYGARIRADWLDHPGKYFQRREIGRTEIDIRDYLADLWAEGRMMREAELADRAPRNPDSCHRFGTCPFWAVCAYGVEPASHPEIYARVADVHPELELEAVA